MGAALRRHNLPSSPQFCVARVGRNRGRSFYLDFALPDYMIAIECDGKAFHSTARQKAKDARRQAELEMLGWTFLRFTGSEICTDVEICVQAVLALLKRTTPI